MAGGDVGALDGKGAGRALRDGGRIIAISTLNTRLHPPGGALYTGAKGALENFTKVAAIEFGRRRITANVVSPGATDTEMLRAANPGETFEDTAARTALRRLGRPEDIAAVVAFLAGPDSGWISGQNLAADGGLLPSLYAGSMSTMDQWTAAVCADLGLDASAADLRAVLDLTRDVAHGVARPAAPLTAYLVGVAVGRGLTLPDAAGRVSALAARWEKEE
jgi:hypothetical protein